MIYNITYLGKIKTPILKNYYLLNVKKFMFSFPLVNVLLKIAVHYSFLPESTQFASCN